LASASTTERLCNVESGIITTWVRNVGDELTEPFPCRPELVGQPQPVLVLGKGSGLDSVAAGLDRLGRTLTPPEQMQAILDEVKALSLETKMPRDFETFAAIVDRVTA
jgi:isopropylmalate/homocitrate/citramalate synthase